MKRLFSVNCLAFFLCVAGVPFVGAQDTKFDVNDVAFLWPVATDQNEVDQLISLDDPLEEGEILSDKLFKQLLAIAKSEKVKIKDSQIQFPPELENRHNWKVVGFRVNPSSLGGSDEMIKKLGQVPGIRLVAQPVTIQGGKVKVHDYAAHIAFNYAAPSNPTTFIPFIPEHAEMASIITDLREIKTLASKTGNTEGELSIHPGFTSNALGFRDKLRNFLRKHLRESKLQVISFMGIDPPEPWIFFSVMRQPAGDFFLRQVGGFGSAPTGQPTVSSQMLSFRGGDNIVPAPPQMDPDSGGGISMALLFNKKVPALLANPALLDEVVFSVKNKALSSLTLKEVPDVIANPRLQNTLTTDCVSCHTETTLRSTLKIKFNAKDINKMLQFSATPRVDKELLPEVSSSTSWNVRNFGWFQKSITAPARATVTVRAANEAEESAGFLNANLNGISPLAPHF